MKMKNLWLFLFIFIFALVGHAHSQDSNKKGADKKEKEVVMRKVKDKADALQIAKDYLAQEGMQADYHLVGHLTKPLAKLKDGVWHVVFLKKRKNESSVNVKSIRIKIDETTAQVIEHIEQDGFYIDKSFR